MDPDKQQRLDDEQRQQDTAADLIRTKLNKLYGTEPDAEEEIAEVTAMPQAKLSKHQQYMKSLSGSGRNPDEIQAAWHEYYAGLSDDEKHEVWEEFYSEHARVKQQTKQPTTDKPEVAAREPGAENITEEPAAGTPGPAAAVEAAAIKHPVSYNTARLRGKRGKKASPILSTPDMGTVNDIRTRLLSQVQDRAHIRKNPHVRALAFGLSMGTLTIFVLLFGFFNERFITPFIRPNASVSATPIIVDPGATGPIGQEAKIIIPKINVEAPVVYDVPSISEEDVQKGLENGVVHYITTPNPGEKGNSVIFGHSSSNILNKGKYKYAFILLKSLEKDDTFIVQKDGKRYVYKVYNKFVTSPQDLSVLGNTGRPATMTLITCDPPGTSTNRLIIQAEQIFPDPATNAESSTQPAATQAGQSVQLPSNSTTLWQRIQNWF